MSKLDPAKVRLVATALAEELLGVADPILVDAIVKEIEVQVATGGRYHRPVTPIAKMLELRTDELLERIKIEVALQDVPRSSEKH